MRDNRGYSLDNMSCDTYPLDSNHDLAFEVLLVDAITGTCY